jgi:hypothetical protein
MGRADLCLPLI